MFFEEKVFFGWPCIFVLWYWGTICQPKMIDYEKGDNSVLQILSLKTRGATLRWQIQDFWTSGLLISFYIHSYRLFRNKEYLRTLRDLMTQKQWHIICLQEILTGVLQLIAQLFTIMKLNKNPGYNTSIVWIYFVSTQHYNWVQLTACL